MHAAPVNQPPTPDRDPLAAYDYHLPSELIAQHPASRRDQARLLCLPRHGGDPGHGRVSDLPGLLRAGDLLVVNDTRVVPARIAAQRPSGGKVELFLLSPANPLESDDRGELHQALLRSSARLGPGEPLLVPDWPGALEVRARGPKGQAQVWVPGRGLALAEAKGQVPLPPYIKRPQGPDSEDAQRYQTVYAQHPGAVAAPTAGLHLSQELLAALEAAGVGLARLTLHVGYGTFAEPDPADLAAGRLHAEWVRVSAQAAQAIARTKAAGGRVIAVGTTSARSLEWAARGGEVQSCEGWCDLLIGPGYDFRAIDGLLTNFHLPRTTLLMLVAALAGRRRVLAAYAQAVDLGYRFYSFGDAMLVCP